MLKRYGLPLVLFGLAVFSGFIVYRGYRTQPTCAETLSRLRKDDDRPKAANQSNTVTCERDCQVSFGLAPDADATESNQGGEQNSECDTVAELDLLAQRQMAHWAGISALLAMIGVFGVLWTLRESRRIGQAQVRAYLHAAKVEASFNYDKFYCEVSIENTGQSPATNIRLEYASRVFKTPIRPEDSKNAAEKTEPGIMRPIAANTSEMGGFTTDPLPMDLQHAFMSHPGLCIEFFGKIFWDDVFGRFQEQDFEFSMAEIREDHFLTFDPNGTPRKQTVDLLPGLLVVTE